jgi:hypothetical protein
LITLCVRGGSEKAVHTRRLFGDRQFFLAVGVFNDEVHIGEFADFPQGFRLREGSIVVSTETGIKCFGAALWRFRL